MVIFQENEDTGSHFFPIICCCHRYLQQKSRSTEEGKMYEPGGYRRKEHKWSGCLQARLLKAGKMKGDLEMLTEIDQIVRQEIDLQGPGVAIAVVKDGKPVHIEGYGVANLEWDCPIRPDTVFRLASITKQFTATAIMLLERQGKLRLDDEVTTYLPDYPTHNQTITITHLLNHTSGIKSYTSLDTFLTENAKKDMGPGEVLAYFKDLPLEFKPGTRFLYNNSGYHLLGLIIEKIAEMSYEQFIQQHIFQPLDMHHSYYMHNETIIPRRASGYAKTQEGYRQADYLNMMLPYAAGSLGSTVEDLIRWDATLREGRLLDATTQDRKSVV